MSSVLINLYTEEEKTLSQFVQLSELTLSTDKNKQISFTFSPSKKIYTWKDFFFLKFVYLYVQEC